MNVTMTSPEARKISRTMVALCSTMLLCAAAALGMYTTSTPFASFLDRNMLHQCNGPKRGQKVDPGQDTLIAALAPGLVRLFYMPTPHENRRDFCRCELLCAAGNLDLYMTDYEAFWIYPEFVNDWQPEEDYDCVSTQGGNIKETCEIRGSGDDWYCYIMVRGRTGATGCSLDCGYV